MKMIIESIVLLLLISYLMIDFILEVKKAKKEKYSGDKKNLIRYILKRVFELSIQNPLLTCLLILSDGIFVMPD